MALALCLLFDSRSERAVRELWQRLEEQGVATLLTHTHGRHLPHLSYVVVRDWDDERVLRAVAALPDAGPLDVAVQGSVVFPRGRAALACSLSTEIAARQERAAASMREAGAELHRHYDRGRWVPHVSVATSANGGQLPTIVNAVSAILPLTLRASRAALIDTATGHQERLRTVP